MNYSVICYQREGRTREVNTKGRGVRGYIRQLNAKKPKKCYKRDSIEELNVALATEVGRKMKREDKVMRILPLGRNPRGTQSSRKTRRVKDVGTAANSGN